MIFNIICSMILRSYYLYNALGILEGTRLIFSLFFKHTVTVNVPELSYPIKIRTKTTDINVFEQIFVRQEYNFPIDIKPKLIIDGGANVGYASIFFANKFQEAQIIAVEPEKSNFEILTENISYYPNIKIIESAIWDEDTYLKIKDVGLGKWGFMVEKAQSDESNSFKAVTIQTLLADSGYEKIDILKLDIEGSEKEIFSRNYDEWLGKVRILAIELHDRMKPGCSNAFYSATRNYNFKETQKGENIILERRI